MKRFTPAPGRRLARSRETAWRPGGNPPCMTVQRTVPYPLPIDCAACTITTLGDLKRLELVEIDGDWFAFHPTCLRPGRVRRSDARPLSEQELAQLGHYDPAGTPLLGTD